ncbi:hypothetical protein [Desulfobacter latus]|uniref:Uncharacterized protein n=1 Tax=Desulfobacter latus TaxID=2292 RepID=A0A850T7F6_9BACT|nr:hypothetical protein [Desulfobacter latus]NWH04167.1 hypothetical protein [Desulfobacter latus]
MSTEKVTNRCFGVVGTILMQIVFCVMCVWFVFTKVLFDPFNKSLSDSVGADQSTAVQTARIFSSALFFVGLIMIFSSLRW